jgi:very-short-patch-repair endonuclease
MKFNIKSKVKLRKPKEKTKSQRITFEFTPKVNKKLPLAKYIVDKKFIKSSSLETEFEDYVLKKLGYKYVAQYRVATKYYDFYIPDYKLLIEVDGDYWHGNTKKPLNDMQKKNKINDFIKDKIALLNNLGIIRFTEKDIRNNPKKCLRELNSKILFRKNKI